MENRKPIESHFTKNKQKQHAKSDAFSLDMKRLNEEYSKCHLETMKKLSEKKGSLMLSLQKAMQKNKELFAELKKKKDLEAKLEDQKNTTKELELLTNVCTDHLIESINA
ncbi:hypothetical protein M9Y10_021908 [Tritrichomonas musculus]|uniref:Uncharacterized protein n=1 Tax=Tritrichomonas musculus TaxID=1915356 RepID=A0ABR2KR23_9EUKA